MTQTLSYAGMKIREQLRKMGVRYSPTANGSELRALLHRQPMTYEQIEQLREMLKPTGRDAPTKLTYGEAAERIKVATILMNQDARSKLNLAEGQVLQREDRYYYVERLYGEQKSFRMRLLKVRLRRANNVDTESKAEIEPLEGEESFVANPYNWLYLCMVVDLATWQPVKTLVTVGDEAPF